MLSERKKKILKALVDEYRETGQSVGSAVLTKKSKLGLSSATLRHELSELEEQGYLSHAHASAGRIPTETGLRTYVTELLTDRPVSDQDRQRVQGIFKKPLGGAEDLIHRAIHVLTDLSGHLGVGLAPRFSGSHLRRLELIPLSDQEILAVIVTDSGLVRNKVIEFSERMVEEEMRRVAAFLEEAYRDTTFDEIRETFLSILERNKEQTRDLLREAVTISRKCFFETSADELFLEGLPSLFREHDYRRQEAMALMDFLSGPGEFSEFLAKRPVPSGVQVLIGSEIPYPAMQHMGLALASYELDGRTAGTLGVIGPMQMDYAAVVPLVRYTAQTVSEHLNQKRRERKRA